MGHSFIDRRPTKTVDTIEPEWILLESYFLERNQSCYALASLWLVAAP
jgi:hypothetical protein